MEKNKRITTAKLTLSAMFLALGMVLPFLTGQMQQIGNMLLPMHLPVFLCGLICGWQYGAIVGFFLPLLRSITFGMPPLYPTALAMALELAAYGLVAGILYGHSWRKGIKALYQALIVAMLVGRIVWGAAEVVLLGLTGNTFTWKMFLSGALLNAIPGIMIQLVLIPGIMVMLAKTGFLRFTKQELSESDTGR